MIPALHALACLVFYTAFLKLSVAGRTRALLAAFKSAARVVGDRALNDTEKEALIRRAALRTMADTTVLVARIAAVLTCAALPVLLATQVSGIGLEPFLAFSLEPPVLLGAILALFAMDRVRQAISG
jgi:hypothetical protein